MHRRRLVHPPDDRLEVADVERPRVEVAVPADDVEWMMVENELVDAVVLLDEELEVAHLVVGVQHERTADVALGVWRALLELAELVPIALGPANVPAAFHDEQLRAGWGRELIAMQ